MELVISDLSKEYNGFYAVSHVSLAMGTHPNPWERGEGGEQGEGGYLGPFLCA